MKVYTALPMASLSLILLFGCFIYLPPPTVEQRIRLRVPVADHGEKHHQYRPSLLINVKKSGQMLDYDGKPMSPNSLRVALTKYAEKSAAIERPRHTGPTVTIRADRNSSVRSIRLIYDEAVNAGYSTMNFRVHTSEKRRS